ncbi:unnamed protein product [Periconia digitata]|uniref:Uncharacterized protein n=1 Tax=Periconia digitata TaxID=1303443 RepID=A0A9W4XUP9_9PLEO|nr:unnamed protein product [Periconia digitata]
MGIPKLPSEIFNKIIYQLVVDLGMCGAWKLRLVSRSFKAEIRYCLFAQQPCANLNVECESHGGDFTRCAEILEKNIVEYLGYLSKNSRDAAPDLPRYISDMSSYIIRELDIVSKEEELDVVDTMCKGMVRVMGADRVVRTLFSELQDDSSKFEEYRSSRSLEVRGLSEAHIKAAAAICMNAKHLVSRLIKQGTMLSSTGVLRPLRFAIHLADLKMVKMIAPRVTRSAIGRNEKTDSNGVLSDIDDAVTFAIQEGSFVILDYLVNVRIEERDNIRYSQFDKWLYRAIRRKRPTMLKTFLRLHHLVEEYRGSIGGSGEVIFRKMCMDGDVDNLSTLVRLQMKDPKARLPWSSAVLDAVKSRNPEILKWVLDSGFHPDGQRRYTRVMDSSNFRPLGWAIHKEEGYVPDSVDRIILRLLLSYGANDFGRNMKQSEYRFFSEVAISMGFRNIPTWEVYSDYNIKSRWPMRSTLSD